MKTKEEREITTAITMCLDINAREMPDGLVDKLKETRLYAYKDVLFENHLYPIDELLGKMKDDPGYFSFEQELMINRIARLLDKKGCEYFRFKSNP